MRRVAIVGGGAAGMGAAFRLLKAGREVTLFEAREHLGGDCLGVDVDLHTGGTVRVDGGVCDYNRATCRDFDAFLDEIGGRRTPIVDDAAFMTPEGELLGTWRRGRPRGRPDAPTWLAEVDRFDAEAREVLGSLFYVNWSAERYLASRGYSEEFRRLYFYPRTLGCFPMLESDPAEMPIRSLVSAWRMCGLLDHDSSQRLTLSGGLHGYGDIFTKWFLAAGGRLLLSWRVVGATREGRGAVLRALDHSGSLTFFEVDDLVLAMQPDRAIDLLDDATAAERILAAAFEMRHTRVVVHQDARLMPRDRDTWAGFNYPVGCDAIDGLRPAMTIYLNRVQSLPAEVPDVFVTINPHREPYGDKIVDDRMLIHPAPGSAARETTRLVGQIQGRRHTWFCGSYLREPFLPEQSLRSGYDVAERIRDHRATPYADGRLRSIG